MENFVDFDEYGNAVRGAFRNPESYIERVRENNMFDDRSLIADDDMTAESYYYLASKLPHDRRHYGHVRVPHHRDGKMKHYVVSGQMIHSMVPSFQAAATGYNAKENTFGTKYPEVSEDRDVHTTPMWRISTALNGNTMKVEAPIEGELFDQNVKKTDLHIGAPLEDENGKSFFSIHGISSLISASLKGGQSGSVFSFKPESSREELSVASKMAPALDDLKDKCHALPVGAEMLAPINKKLPASSPVHLVIEEHPATAFASTFTTTVDGKQVVKNSETVPLTNAAAHIAAMRVSAPIKDAMLNTLSGAYMAKRLQSGVAPITVEAFHGQGRAYKQIAAPHAAMENNHAVHEYTDEPAGTLFVGVRLNGSESVVCHVTSDADKQTMTTIRSAPSAASNATLTKVTNMNGRSYSAQRVESPFKKDVRGSGKALTFVH